MKAIRYEIGDSVVTPDGAGVVTDCFRGPASGATVYTVTGLKTPQGEIGYYMHELILVQRKVAA
jgi:hypothetical protein